MMHRTCTFLTLVTALCFVSSSPAELLVHEPFDYEIGGLNGQDGGVGFGEPWTADDEFYSVVRPDPPMSFVVPGGGAIGGGNRALQFANETDFTLEDELNIIFRELAGDVESDDIYISYLYRYVAGDIDDNDFVVWWFNNQGGPNIGLKGNRGDGSGIEDLMARLQCCGPPHQEFAPDVDISDDAGTIGEDHFLVGRLSRAGNSDDPLDYDQFDFWVNPGVGDEGNPDSSGIANPADSFNFFVASIGMRVFSQEPDDTMMWDELRIGTTWADVVSPSGEPLLRAGDANQDLEFNFDDILQVLAAGLFETGLPATWGQGDWDNAPGGSQGNPPPGDGFFDFNDILAALAEGLFETGPYAAGSAAAVPEPSTVGLLSLAVLLFAARRPK